MYKPICHDPTLTCDMFLNRKHTSQELFIRYCYSYETSVTKHMTQMMQLHHESSAMIALMYGEDCIWMKEGHRLKQHW